jgi:hypothetical protein
MSLSTEAMNGVKGPEHRPCQTANVHIESGSGSTDDGYGAPTQWTRPSSPGLTTDNGVTFVASNPTTSATFAGTLHPAWRLCEGSDEPTSHAIWCLFGAIPFSSRLSRGAHGGLEDTVQPLRCLVSTEAGTVRRCMAVSSVLGVGHDGPQEHRTATFRHRQG